MKITVGDTVLGTSPEEVEKRIIGGFSASGSSETQNARGKCNGTRRLKILGNAVATLDVPTTREFESVAAAEKFCVDTAITGAIEGAFLAEYKDGSNTEAGHAIATPTSLTYAGLTVFAVWNIEIGEALTT